MLLIEDAAVVQLYADGFEALRCTGLSETLMTRQVPADLSAKPTLSVLVRQAVGATLHPVRVTTTGTKIVVIDSGTLTLESGQVRTAIAVDAPGGGAPFDLLILEDLN